jgi:hypothetical protein
MCQPCTCQSGRLWPSVYSHCHTWGKFSSHQVSSSFSATLRAQHASLSPGVTVEQEPPTSTGGGEGEGTGTGAARGGGMAWGEGGADAGGLNNPG